MNENSGSDVYVKVKGLSQKDAAKEFLRGFCLFVVKSQVIKFAFLNRKLRMEN
jgi:hypothetical protein